MVEYEGGRLIAETGDITRIKTDAVVNAANSTLLGGAGVDGAIHGAGGSAILEACKDIRRRRYPNGLPTGKAVITTAGALPATHVIHTVGPVWRGGNADEARLLEDAYRNSLELATETGLTGIAFPAISTGAFGFPRELAARIAYRTISEYLKKHALPREVRLIFFSENDLQVFERSVRTDPDV